MIRFLVSILSIFSYSPLFSVSKEYVSKNEIFTGDTFQYSIEFDQILPASLTFPDGDFFEDGDDLPLFKVISVSKIDNKLTLNLRFYSPGEYILPIEWEENGDSLKSSLRIQVKSRLKNDQKDIEENDPPILFSGRYLHRLILAIAIFMLLCYLLYAFFIFWKKQTKIVNAEWEKIPEIEPRKKKLYLMEDSLKNETIIFKDFCYLFTSYCKEEYSYRLSADLLHQTDSEFLAYLYDHSGIEDSDLREIRNLFRSVKYLPNEKILSRDEAIQIWTDWKTKLKI